MRFWIGGWGAQLGGEATGITALTAGGADAPTAGGALALVGDAVEAPSPSWLAAHPALDVVYAALEGDGRVAAYRPVGDAKLVPLGEPVDAGEAVCHVAVSPGGGFLVASCWGDGRVVRIALDADGRPGARAVAAAADDPYGAPATGEEALSDGERADVRALMERGVGAAEIAALLAAGSAGAGASRDEGGDAGGGQDAGRGAGSSADRDAGGEPDAGGAGAGGADAGGADGGQDDAAADLGALLRPTVRAPAAPRASRAHCALFLPDGRVATTDLGYDLVRIWRPTRGRFVPDHDVALPFGVGPRHLLAHPSGHLHVVTEFSAEVFTLGADRAGRWRILGGVPASALAGDTGGEIARSRDGSFLYAGMRGSDTISVLRVRGDGDRVEPVALVEAGVAWPRHHVVVRDTLVVAGQRSHEVAALALDERTGVPGRARHRISVPSPTVILPTR